MSPFLAQSGHRGTLNQCPLSGVKLTWAAKLLSKDEARRIATNIAKLPSDLAEASMSTLTIYLARLIGLSAVLLVVALLARGNALIMATVADGPVMLVYAIFSLAAGLAIILGHNVWSGGEVPVIVTLVGWLKAVHEHEGLARVLLWAALPQGLCAVAHRQRRSLASSQQGDQSRHPDRRHRQSRDVGRPQQPSAWSRIHSAAGRL